MGNIHDNVFIAAGRRAGYILTKEDAAVIRRKLCSSPITPKYVNSVFMNQFSDRVVAEYIQMCKIQHKVLKMINIH